VNTRALQTCPRCRITVLPLASGRCPSCDAEMNDGDGDVEASQLTPTHNEIPTQQPSTSEDFLDARTPQTNWPTASENVSMWTPGQIAWCTFLGAPIAGSILIAMNYSALGERSKRNSTILYGVLGTIGVLVVAMLLPDNFPNSPLLAAQVVAMHQLAKRYQGQAVMEHLSYGGRRASSWLATGIGLLSAFALVSLIAFVSMVLPDSVML